MMPDNTYSDNALAAPTESLHRNNLQSLQNIERKTDNFIRRSIDILVPFLSLFGLWLPFLFIALWIKIDSDGPIFHRATRVGKSGNEFKLLKFRSMVVDSAKNGAGITTADDVRVTKSGKFLRRTKIDELPQLLNVLAGHMSLVGPRPEDPRYVALYSPAQLKVLDTKPGITSAASLKYRNEEEILCGEDWEEVYINQLMPDKLAVDLEYLAQRTLLSDAKLIYKTVLAMFQ